MAALGAGHFPWWWLSGILMAVAFVPVALFGPRTALGQFALIAPVLLIVTVVCTLSEVVVFFPQYTQRALQDFRGGVIMYGILAVVLALLAWLLKLSRPTDLPVPHRSFSRAALMTALSGLTYVLYYLVFGGITYQFFTKSYYPDGPQLVARLGLWFWGIELARGILMTLAVVPVIHTLRMKRWHTAIVVGLLIWILGGLAPLVAPNELMGPTQRLIHTVEIFTQNFPLGVTAVLLLRPRSAQIPAGIAAASSAGF
ncbi:MAG TPA: hypothetical protein VKB66_06880 [Candidatus Acidoferrum sp.]|nr:hypothetical protein [Candidatus Acidoferrum sp.]